MTINSFDKNPFFTESDVPTGTSIDSLEDMPPIQQQGGFSDVLKIQDVLDREADRKLREHFGGKSYKLAKKTLYGWAIVVGFYGFFNLFNKQIFPVESFIAITTAVTLNVFAAFLGVIRGLFPSNKS